MIRALAGFVVAVSVAVLSAQAPSRFEVASIKPTQAGSRPLENAPDQFYRSNATFQMLLRTAYDLPTFRIVGAPDWTLTERFDVSAKAPTAQPFSSTQRMLQQLLKDRFRLNARMEVRELPIYMLVQARDDKQLGPRLQRSTFDCAAFVAMGGALEDAPKRPDGRLSICVTTMIGGPGGRTLTTGGMGMSEFAQNLEGFVARTVIDKTGLTGTFDSALTFATEGDTTTGGVADGVAIFTAIQEQLGLKLEPSRAGRSAGDRLGGATDTRLR